MRFWLGWAVVTLPVAASAAIWLRSFWVRDDFRHYGQQRCFVFWFDDGSFAFTRIEQPVLHWMGWEYRTDNPHGDSAWITSNHLLGFGYKETPWPYAEQTIVVMPMWFITALMAIPFAWCYARKRKSRKIGFPVEPIVANSTESTPAQTD